MYLSIPEKQKQKKKAEEGNKNKKEKLKGFILSVISELEYLRSKPDIPLKLANTPASLSIGCNNTPAPHSTNATQPVEATTPLIPGTLQ